jgi:hypothetical protein
VKNFIRHEITQMLEADLRISFRTERETALEFLRVDPEPKRSGMKKKLSVEGNELRVHFRRPR